MLYDIVDRLKKIEKEANILRSMIKEYGDSCGEKMVNMNDILKDIINVVEKLCEKK